MSNVVALNAAGLRTYTPEQMALIRRTVAQHTTPDEFNMFMMIAQRAGLDPFRRQLYCIVYSKDDPERRKVAFITGIDGLRAVAQRNGDYRPDSDEPQFEVDEDRKGTSNPAGLVKAVVKAYKRAPDGQWFAVAGVAYWSEFAVMKTEGSEGFEWVESGQFWPSDHPTKAGKPKMRKKALGEVSETPDGKWKDMPHVMLAKCAEAQALRKGWPEDLSALYSPEEMERPILDVTPSAAAEQHETDKRLRLVNAKDTIAVIWKGGQPIEAVPVGQMADKCLAHIKETDSVTGLDWWWATNEVSLRAFWALHKADALAVKQAHEARKAALAE